jgi:hypothetical protein
MPALSLLYSVGDSKGQVSTFEINIPSATPLAAAIAFGQALATLVNNVTKGVITRVGVVIAIALPGGVRVAALADSDVEEGAKFQFNTAAGFRTGFRLPTFDESKIASNSRGVDLEDVDVAAMVNAIVSGLLAGGSQVNPTDKRESDVTALTSAKEQFLSSRA